MSAAALERRLEAPGAVPGGVRVEVRSTGLDPDRTLAAIAALLDRRGPELAAAARHHRASPLVFDLGLLGLPNPTGPASAGGWRYPVRLTHASLVLGPLLPPGGAPCPACLDRRWRGLRPAEEQRALETASEAFAYGVNPHLSPLVLERAADVVHGALSAPGPSPGRPWPPFHELDLRSLTVARYLLVPDAECPSCASAPEDCAAAACFVPASRTKRDPREYRLAAPRDYALPTLGYVNPVSGLLGRQARPMLFGTVNSPVSGSFSIRSKYDFHEAWWSGQGTRFATSRSLGFLEGLERLAGLTPRGRRTVVRAAYRDLGDDAIDPASCGLYEPSFYAGHAAAYRPYAPDREYYWVWGHSFARGGPVLVPEQLVYYLDRRSDQAHFVQDCSSGCATGSCLEEAVLFGLLELVERDSFLLAWYARFAPPRIDPWSCRDRETLFMADRVARLGYDVHLFDLRADLAIPSVMAMASRRTPGLGQMVVAAAASLDPEQAIEGALSEVASYVPGFTARVEAERDRLRTMATDYTLVKGIHDHALLWGLPEMWPHAAFLFEGERPRPADDVYASWAGEYSPGSDLRQDLLFCVGRVRAAGLDVIVVDQTSPEQEQVGLKTACVLCPGLLPMDFGHDRRRGLDLPRLRRLPRLLGRRPSDLARVELNPAPHPFP
jgi:ribosomal protein S12 methylthiotransferase accessory factor